MCRAKRAERKRATQQRVNARGPTRESRSEWADPNGTIQVGRAYESRGQRAQLRALICNSRVKRTVQKSPEQETAALRRAHPNGPS